MVVDADVLGRRRTGDETYVRGLLAGLSTRSDGFDIRATTTRPDLVPSGVTPLGTPARSGQLRRLSWGLPRRLRQSGAQLLHGNYFLPVAWRGPAVVTVHDVSFARHHDFMPWHDLLAFRILVPLAMSRAARVLTVSEWAKADLVERYGLAPDRVVVTPNGVDDDLSPTGPRERRPPYVLFVGGLQRRKDPVTAVRALARLDPELHLVIVGPDRGEGREVRRVVDELGLGARVEVLHYVERDRLVELYRGAVALVFPSRYEGFGLPVLEAMACGTPVVAARATSLPEVVGDAGILVDPADPEALAEGVGRAVADADRLVAAGVERASGFRWSVTAARAAAVYAEVLAE